MGHFVTISMVPEFHPKNDPGKGAASKDEPPCQQHWLGAATKKAIPEQSQKRKDGAINENADGGWEAEHDADNLVVIMFLCAVFGFLVGTIVGRFVWHT